MGVRDIHMVDVQKISFLLPKTSEKKTAPGLTELYKESVGKSDLQVSLAKQIIKSYLEKPDLKLLDFVKQEKFGQLLAEAPPRDVPRTLAKDLKKITGEDIDVLRIALSATDEQSAVDLTNDVNRETSKYRNLSPSDKKQKQEVSRSYLAFEDRTLRVLKNIARLNREVEELRAKPNKSEHDLKVLERKDKKLQEFKDAYQRLKEQTRRFGIDTSRLDNTFVKLDIFKSHQLFSNNSTPNFPIDHVNDDSSTKQSSFGKLTDALAKESFQDTLLRIKQRINESAVDQVLKEKKEFLEELQKIVDKKMEAGKLEARIEKNNADINRLREKHAEIKRELQALSKRENIDPKVVAQIESIVKGLNKLDALAAKNIINKETFKADLERNNPNVKNYMDLSMEFIDAEEESKNLLDIFMSGQIQTDDSKKILTQSLVGGLQNILSGKNNNVPRTKNNILEAISNRTGVMTTAIERKLDKEQLHFFEDIEMVTEKIKGLLAKLNTLSNSSVLGNSDMAEGELKKIMGAIKDASKLIKSKELTGGNNAVDNILDQLGKLENKLA